MYRITLLIGHFKYKKLPPGITKLLKCSFSSVIMKNAINTVLQSSYNVRNIQFVKVTAFALHSNNTDVSVSSGIAIYLEKHTFMITMKRYIS